jgi:hypothetical protein
MTTIREYVEEQAAVQNVTLEEAARNLYNEVEQGTIRIIDPAPPRVFQEYLLSYYSAYFWLIILTLGVFLSTVYLLPQIPPFNWIRVGLGMLTSLYLPGHVFIEALYPQRSELEELERFALSIGLSLALTPLVGFILNYTPWGIRLDPITVAITLLTILLGLFSEYRKYQYHILGLELS